jgi:hypothetical protein
VDEVPSWVIFSMAGLLLATALATLWAAIKRNLLATAIGPGVGFAIAFLFVAAVVFPMADAFKSGRDFAAIIEEETAASRAAGHEVLALDLGNLPIHYAFYSNGIYAVETKEIDDLARHFDRDQQVFAIANAKRLGELPTEIRDRMEVISITHASRREVVLISNRPSDQALEHPP